MGRFFGDMRKAKSDPKKLDGAKRTCLAGLRATRQLRGRARGEELVVIATPRRLRMRPPMDTPPRAKALCPRGTRRFASPVAARQGNSVEIGKLTSGRPGLYYIRSREGSLAPTGKRSAPGALGARGSVHNTSSRAATIPSKTDARSRAERLRLHVERRWSLCNGHAPGHVRDTACEAFEAWIAWDGKGAEPTVEHEIHYEPHQITLSRACGLVCAGFRTPAMTIVCAR